MHINANYDLLNQAVFDNKNILVVQHKNEDKFNLASINNHNRKLNIHNVFELISNEIPMNSIELVINRFQDSKESEEESIPLEKTRTAIPNLMK